jgi:DNA-binding winged helix-turn-helix (wHTH) protein
MVFHLLSRQKVTRGLQMFDARLRAFKREWHQCLSLRLQARPPEVAGHLDLIERYWAERVVGRRRANEQGES